MIHRLTDDIWFGNYKGIFECEPAAVVNVAARIKEPAYWKKVQNLPWKVWFFHVGQPDEQRVDDTYLDGLSGILDSISAAGKTPLFCHCAAGRHRGPTCAVFAYWHLGGRTRQALNRAYTRMVELNPKWGEDMPHKVYRRMALGYMRRHTS